MKLKLDQDSLTEEFFDNTRLLGIMAPFDSYFFCWQVNNTLGTDFRLNNEFEIQLKRKKRDYFFNIYQWQEDDTTLFHYIYYNKFDGEYLLPEFKNIDFLWLMKGEYVDVEKCKDIKDAIKSIDYVQLVVELDYDKIINKGNLVF